MQKTPAPKHPWYLYFDNKPQDKVQDKRIIGQDTTVKYNPKKRVDTANKPHFPIQGEICEDLNFEGCVQLVVEECLQYKPNKLLPEL